MKDPTPSEIMLEAVRGFHAHARQLLAKRKPDKAAAKHLMQEAQRLGNKVAPYLPPDAVLRQRVVADDPMSEEEWERLRGPSLLEPR